MLLRKNNILNKIEINKIYKSSTILLACYWGYGYSALALPGMSVNEIINWSENHSIIQPFELNDQYNISEYSNFNSSFKIINGTVSYSVFLNESKTVESENIDYRPNCYGTKSCSGIVKFEQADTGNGETLIKDIWGEEIFNYFKTSQLIETDLDFGTKRWYQGKLYNYETWHYDNNTIVHFSIVSKQSSQPQRIQEYRYCLTNFCE